MNAGGLVVVERIGATAVVTLNAPARRNALSLPLRAELLACLAEIMASEGVRAVVLTGAGGTFCSGGDLSDMAVTDFATGRERMRATHRLVRLLALSAKPVVVAVEGWAAGAGLSLALCCDLIVAASDARFVASFARVGLIGDLGLLHTLPRRVGQGWARRMLLLADPVDAATAERIGLADAVVPPGTARDAALGWAGRLAQGAPLPQAITKALLADGLDAALEREAEAQARLFLSADHAEGKAAFFAKRDPTFSGR